MGKLSPVFWWIIQKQDSGTPINRDRVQKPDFCILVYIYIYIHIPNDLKTYFRCFNMQKLLEFLQRTLCIALVDKHLLHYGSVLFT